MHSDPASDVDVDRSINSGATVVSMLHYSGGLQSNIGISQLCKMAKLTINPSIFQ
jgi:hypothetical protein